MNEKLLKATHTGILPIGEYKISCAVLEDGTRVLVERSMATALEKKGGGSYWEKKKKGEKSALLPEYISLKNLQPFITNELRHKLENPIIYMDKNNRERNGIEAIILPEICDIWITAKEKSALTPNQEKTAKIAYILMKGFANVGIIALVDEATGYQELRDKKALEKILEKYISKELMKWQKTFPDEFYELIFKLRNWAWKGRAFNPPPIVGKLTNDIVYDRLAPGVRQELERLNPPNEKGIRKNRNFQWLTSDIGHPKLKEHLIGVIALMRGSSNWPRFHRALVRAYPKSGEQIEIPGIDIDE